MFGTILNVSGILVGGVAGRVWRRSLSPARQAHLKVVLAAVTAFVGLRLCWLSISGTVYQVFKQLLILVLAMLLGRLTGRMLRLQKMSNALGRRARDRVNAARPDQAAPVSEGFKVCAALFCAAPLGILGATVEGLTLAQYFYPLAIKAVIDGLAAMGFVVLFGWGVLLSALPVLVFQGTLALICAHLLAPVLGAHGLVDSVNAVAGMLLASVALVILAVKRVELADYLPSLLYAPLITWLAN